MDATSSAHAGQAHPEKLGRKTSPESGLTPSILIHEVKSSTDSPQTRENRDLRARLVRAARHVADARDFLPYVQDRDEKRAEKLADCGSWLLFNQYVQSGECRLASGIFCQQPLLCGFCAAGRASRQAQALTERIVHVVGSHRHLRPYMVTLTIKSQPELKPMVTQFWDSWSAMIRRRKRAVNGRGASVMGKMAGGFMAGEAKRGNSGEHHYHGHGIFLADIGRYQPVWERFTREWATLNGQSHASVQFQPLKGSSLLDTVRETCKYASKWQPGQYADRWEAFQALTRVRRVRTFGKLYGVKLPEEVVDDLSDVEAEEYVERAFSYVAGSYKEVKHAQRESAFDDWNEGKEP